MNLLAVGCGRDGTTSITALLRALYKANVTDTQREDMSIARHENNHIDLYAAVIEYVRFGSDSLVKDTLFGWDHLFECGNGYAWILPIIREVFGPIKLILLVREQTAHINSLLRRPQLNPQNWGGYIDIGMGVSTHPVITRPTAVDFSEMSSREWWRLTLRDRISWYREKSLSLVRSHSKLFPSYLELRTESLSDFGGIAQLASFIDPRWVSDVEAFHIGSSVPVDYGGGDAKRRHKKV